MDGRTKGRIMQQNLMEPGPKSTSSEHLQLWVVLNLWDAAGWQVEDAYIQVTDNGKKPILGRDYLTKLGFKWPSKIWHKNFG